MKTNETARRVMILAHAFRREAAARHNCKASEILFGECLKMAWNAMKTRPEMVEQYINKVEEKKVEKKAASNKIPTNEKGFVAFQHRNWNYNGDKNTWARVDGDKLIVNIGKGIISSGYMEELESFLAPYNLNITTGRVSVAL